MTFWKQVDQLRETALGGELDAAKAMIRDIGGSYQTGNEDLDGARRNMLELLSRTFDLGYVDGQADAVPAVVHPLDFEAGRLPGINPGGAKGVSLVTCCMNREENLIRALHSWIACRDISEIIIVDWSSDQPVRAALAEAGITDPRVRVVRVEGESRWILTYAFNVGFRVAACDRILKVDADIVLEPEFFTRNRLRRKHFIAGNWRRAAQNQAHVNGFFYLFKKDLAEIAGFNEHITTYGWDDDDIYERLERHGVVRKDVDIDTIFHLPHSDEERVGASGDDTDRSGRAELRRDTMHKIRCNRLLAYIMPYWHEGKTLLPLLVETPGDGDLTLRREGWMPHPVPDHIMADTEHYAALELTAWRLGQRVFELDRDRLGMLLEKPFSSLGKIDVEIALGNKPETVRASGGYLVVCIEPDSIPGDNPAGKAFEVLTNLARERGLTLILSGPWERLPETALGSASACAFLPGWADIGVDEATTLEQLQTRAPGTALPPVRLTFDKATIDGLNAMPAGGPSPSPSPVASPALSLGRPRIFIDGQHGLGNRLRAIGSAAAIAEKSDSELVVVWQPDDHCECRFGDLFEYDGAVIEESFVDRAAGLGCATYNYMEIESGAEKGAEIRLDGNDVYLRSAYVLNSPLSSWEDENRFLRALRPVAAVRDMVASVRTPNDVSAHVRMAGGKDYEHLPYESLENWTEEGHQQIAHWREKSHFSHFIKRIEALTAEGRADRIFLAADKPDTYDVFRACFGDRLAMLERDVYDRSAEQLRYGLADALLLGSAPILLGSTWSSFSELATRLSSQKMTVEMSGVDF